MSCFKIEKSSGASRAGWLRCEHGEIPTPTFMPVGTLGAVKTLESRELEQLGAKIILSNAYHLYLRPGVEILKQSGGLHCFMNWHGPILVDSGGFQVFSLNGLRKVTDEGVQFQSHIDGSFHLFTPEKVVNIQRAIGADFMMPLDDLVGYPVDENAADKAAQRTWNWLLRGMEEFEKTEPLYGYRQILPPIVQGSFIPHLRRREAERLANLEAPFYAIGGLAVGEEPEQTKEAIEISLEYLPLESAKYCMGIGLPHDLLDAISLGIDLFDCVIPTRNGRNATLFTLKGRMNLRNAKYATDQLPVEENCQCPLCMNYSRAYLHHLFNAKEILGLKLASVHNLYFYFQLMKSAREHILEQDYTNWARLIRDDLANKI